MFVVEGVPQTVMQPSVDALTEPNNITFKFGPYDLTDPTYIILNNDA